ncbi:amidohydrolase [Paenibacillus sp. 481]|uniref:amidohydrolase n=1 Tax=Paenibacillus sp. 481 TaxID=2835869 RepID=UPI001E40FBF7|nr:amidohydrolase [Paenibacillus sp. 481]UHA74242.1 amidohydrolase [Paenibacillus sp. 481]
MSRLLEHGIDSSEWEAIKAQVIAWRRYLHQHPELSFHEVETAQFVEDTLRTFGNLDVYRPTATSVVARLVGPFPGKVLAMRADMDALPIQEENEFEFTSTRPGVMHACGHDGHTAVLLGVAQILSKWQHRLHGEVRFLFQHAEELAPGGAQEMVDAGVMDGVDWVVGAHLAALMETGKIGIVYGAMQASPDGFNITVKGKGGHAAAPHQTIDPIAIGAQIVTNLQHIVSRSTDPLDRIVVSVTQFHAGTTHNVIPSTAELTGTVRTFNPELRQAMPEKFHRLLRGITEAHGAEYELRYSFGYRPVINNDETTKIVEDAAIELFGSEQVIRHNPSMGAEDFSAFLERAPGTFFNIGAGNKEQGIIYPHHHPRFTIDEDSLGNGVRLFIHIADKFLRWS